MGRAIWKSKPKVLTRATKIGDRRAAPSRAGCILRGERRRALLALAQSSSGQNEQGSSEQQQHESSALSLRRRLSEIAHSQQCESATARASGNNTLRAPLNASVRQTSQNHQRRNPHGIDPDYRSGAVLVRWWRLLGSSSRSLVIDGRSHAMRGPNGARPSHRNCEIETEGIQTRKMVGARGFEPPTPSLPD
jgi:hypothetical protein